MQYIQTSSDSYLEKVYHALIEKYEEKELEVDIEVNFAEDSAFDVLKAFLYEPNIYKLDKKEILNFGTAIFGLITDIKENESAENIQDILECTFEFIDGYEEDNNTQVKLYTVLYNIFRQNEKYRYDVFMKLLAHCEKTGCLVVLKTNMLIIDQISRQWTITLNDKINLYQKVVDALHKLDLQLEAYELMLKTVELLGEDEDLITSHKTFVTGTIKSALQHPKIVQFERLYNLPAVQAQKEENKLLYIFTYENLEEYNKWERDNKQYLTNLNIDSQVCRNKMMYLSFCSSAMKDNVLSYDQLVQIVGIKREEIEDWIIDAIVNNIIDARLDQEREQIVINTFTQRTTNLKERLDKTMTDFDSVLKIIRPK
jgi:hypothetical protein